MNAPLLQNRLAPPLAHMIETLSLECRYASEALAWQHEPGWAKFWQGEGLALIEQVFAQFSQPGQVWQIDSLALDLGLFHPHDQPAQWAQRLRQQLQEALLHHAQTQAPRDRGLAASDRELAHFLDYLQHGHLGWAMQTMSTPTLADWLARLARRTGPRLWGMLQQVLPASQTLLRLSQIAPHQGLQALIGIRQSELAHGLTLLDAQLLRPLQARGRLSAYQVQQLQQAWRVAGLHALWGQSTLSADRLRQLVDALTLSLSRALGQGWQTILATLPLGQHLPTAGQRNTDLATLLLQGLTGPYRPPPQEQARNLPPLPSPLNHPLAPTAPSGPLSEASLPTLLAQLEQYGQQAWPAGLRSRQQRRQLLQQLSPKAMAQLLQAMQPSRPLLSPGPVTTTHAATRPQPPWHEAIRQYALSYLAQAGASGFSLSQIESILLDASLARLLSGAALPQDHVAWQLFWRQALPVPMQAAKPLATTISPSQRRAKLAADLAAASRSSFSSTHAAWRIHPQSSTRPTSSTRPAVTHQLARPPLPRLRLSAPHPSHRAATQPPHMDAPNLAQILQIPAQRQQWLQNTSLRQRWQMLQALWGLDIVRLIDYSQILARATTKLALPMPRHEQIALHWQCLASALAGQTPARGLATRALLQAYAAALAQALPTRLHPLALAMTLQALSWQYAASGCLAHIRHRLARHHSPARAPGRPAKLRAMRKPSGKNPPILRTPAVGAADRAPVRQAASPPRYTPYQLPPYAAFAPAPASPASQPGDTQQALQTLLELLELAPRRWTAATRLQVADLLEVASTNSAWLASHSESQREQLLRRQFAAQAPALLQWSRYLKASLDKLLPRLSPQQRTQLHWRMLSQHLFIEGLSPSPDCLLRRYAMQLRLFDLQQAGAQAQSFVGWRKQLHTALQAATRASWGKPSAAQAELSSLHEPSSQLEQWEASLSRVQRGLPVQPSSPPSPLPPPSERSNHYPGGAAQEAIYIANAGLVLLAVYAQRLFGGLQLLTGNAFIDQAASTKAIHALAYLSHGAQEQDETHWVLNKLLCGVALAEPIAPNAAPDPHSTELLDGLLHAVIAHWKTLGNTKPDGLRQTFLQREGRLLQRDGEQGEYWQLQVAKGPFDMLLDHLPWSYKTIKLPWMAKVLYVEWR